MINYSNNDVIVAPDGKWLDFGIDPRLYHVYTSGTGGTVIATPNSGYQGTEVTLSNTPAASGLELYSYSITGATLKNDNQFDIGNKDVYVHGNFGNRLPYTNHFLYSHFAGDTPNNIDGYAITVSNLKLNGEIPPMDTIFTPGGAYTPGSTQYNRFANGEFITVYNSGNVMPDTSHLEPQITYSEAFKLETFSITAYTRYGSGVGKPASLRGRLRAFDPWNDGSRYIAILDFSLPFIAEGNATVTYNYDFRTGEGHVILP